MTDMDIGKVSCSDGAGRFPACAVCSGSVPLISTMAMSVARNGASISEYELDKALARYRQKNHELKARLKKGASYLEAKDVEAIIEIATYGLVKLELTELPLFKQY